MEIRGVGWEELGLQTRQLVVGRLDFGITW